MDNIQLRARLDAIEERLGVLEGGDGGRFPSHGTRGSLSRPVIDGGLQPRDVHKLNDVPVDRDDDLMPLADDDDQVDDQVDDQAGDQAGDQVADQADQARAAAPERAPRRRAPKAANRRGAPTRRRR